MERQTFLLFLSLSRVSHGVLGCWDDGILTPPRSRWDDDDDDDDNNRRYRCLSVAEIGAPEFDPGWIPAERRRHCT
ncbi:hypothetical protein MLD38_038740 [Melastoma candidum]|uniref:Uncharacterized protein n=1 Tax=Melastoma candidum TaxID=119954 RepID=A0ACB9L0I6_9MYRT|nr:hypothetical protein MLD38_038740 [Melastoma candidum]